MKHLLITSKHCKESAIRTLHFLAIGLLAVACASKARQDRPAARTLTAQEINQATASGTGFASYELLSAATKKEVIASYIEKSTYHQAKLPSLQMSYYDYAHLLYSILSPANVIKAFTNTGDFMEPGRKKIFHTYGVTSFLKWQPEPNTGYTGLFDGGDPHCLGRFSFALPPEENRTIPAMSLKFFIDGGASRNLMVMYSLDGQPSHNMFENTFSNIISDPSPSFINGKIISTFTGALASIGIEKPDPNHLFTDHLAKVTWNGNSISDYKTPYRLYFTPTADAKAIMDKPNLAADFRNNLIGKGKDIVLYDVYATDLTDPSSKTESEKKLIAKLISVDNFIASDFGDTKIFYRHFAP